jgi:hypothetical protein
MTLWPVSVDWTLSPITHSYCRQSQTRLCSNAPGVT